jgi:hypothetical protein
MFGKSVVDNLKFNCDSQILAICSRMKKDQANDDIQNDTVGTASLNGISNIEPLSEIVNGLNFRLWI